MSGLTHAKLFYDHFHLALIEEKTLGPTLFNKSKGMLKALKLASYTDIFQKIKQAILTKFAGCSKVIDIVNKYSKLEQLIVAYVIDSTPGSFQRQGSAQSEQNHSSIVSFIGKEFTDELDKLLLILLKRHHYKCLKTNKVFTRQSHDLRLKKNLLENMNPSSEEVEALSHLNMNRYNWFLIMKEAANYYLCKAKLMMVPLWYIDLNIYILSKVC